MSPDLAHQVQEQFPADVPILPHSLPDTAPLLWVMQADVELPIATIAIKKNFNVVTVCLTSSSKQKTKKLILIQEMFVNTEAARLLGYTVEDLRDTVSRDEFLTKHLHPIMGLRIFNALQKQEHRFEMRSIIVDSKGIKP